MKIRLDEKKEWQEVGNIRKIAALQDGSKGVILYTTAGVEVFMNTVDLVAFSMLPTEGCDD